VRGVQQKFLEVSVASFREENDEGSIDREAPDPSDMDDDVDDDTQLCPHCGQVIHELSDFCPHCGQYITLKERPMRKHWWIVLGVVACLIIVLLWLAQEA
jgi:predicted nucleic acid-binding Zn ribbon protein